MGRSGTRPNTVVIVDPLLSGGPAYYIITNIFARVVQNGIKKQKR
jgi:hypothetical protein